jgi:hypothetical protein
MKSEIVVWSYTLSVLLAAYFFIVLGQHIVDTNLVFLLVVVMPLFTILQSIFSKEIKYGLARVVLVSIILGVGLGKLTAVIFLGTIYLLVYLLFGYLRDRFKWQFKYMFAYFDQLCAA